MLCFARKETEAQRGNWLIKNTPKRGQEFTSNSLVPLVMETPSTYKKQKEKINTWLKLSPLMALVSHFLLFPSNINKLRGVHCIDVDTISSPKPKPRYYFVAVFN